MQFDKKEEVRKRGGIQVLHLVPSARRRGAELFAYEAIRYFAERGVRQHVVLLDSRELDLDFSAFEDCGFEMVKGSGKVVRGLRLVGRIWSLAPHSVLAHGGDAGKFLWPFWLKKNKPWLVVRKIGMTSGWIKSVRDPRWFIYRLLYQSFDRVLVLGERMRAEALGPLACRSERVKLAPNYSAVEPFVDDELWHPKRRVRSEKVRLVTVGALELEKNHGLMLKALLRVLNDGACVSLRLVGDGSQRAELESLALQLGIGEHVEFVGAVGNITDYLVDSDVMLLCSRTEGVPGCLIEAGFAALPAVVWEVGDVRCVVNNRTAIITPFGDEEQFVVGVQQVVEDRKLRTRLGANARLHCMHEFSKDVVMKCYLSELGVALER